MYNYKVIHDIFNYTNFVVKVLLDLLKYFCIQMNINDDVNINGSIKFPKH